jgi:hypothetical protein
MLGKAYGAATPTFLWDRAMQGYRAFIIGEDGHVKDRVDLVCQDETEARRLARQLVDGHDVELWQLDRKIETLSPAPKASGSSPKT